MVWPYLEDRPLKATRAAGKVPTKIIMPAAAADPKKESGSNNNEATHHGSRVCYRLAQKLVDFHGRQNSDVNVPSIQLMKLLLNWCIFSAFNLATLSKVSNTTQQCFKEGKGEGHTMY